MLTEEEEIALVDHILYMGQRNFPMTRDDIRSTIIVRYENVQFTQQISIYFFLLNV